MNAGLLLALLALLQLAIAWMADRGFEPIDAPLFGDQVKSYDGLDVKSWFSESRPGAPTLGARRIEEVLRMARLASAARLALTALLVSFVGDVVTAVIVAVARPAPAARWARFGFAVAAAVLTFVGLVGLLIRVATRSLRAVAESHSEFLANGVGRKSPRGRYLARVRSFETLTPYLTASFIGSVVAIIAAAGA